MGGLLHTELQRSLWRRERQRLHLDDPGASDFCGDVFGFEPDPFVRLLVLPADPESEVLEFNQDFWSLLETLPDPVHGGQAVWGSPERGRRVAMLARTTQKKCYQYLAVFRSGAVEMALGDFAMFECDGKRWFRLVTLVGNCWSALEACGLIAQRFGLPGPCQVTLALRGTKGASLSNVGQGWEQRYEFAKCAENQLALVLELAEPPVAQTAKDTAFLLGSRVEESFGCSDRRFLDREGPNPGEFAASSFRWG
ncbi:MAG: hypothetical protein GXY46_00915 [Actinobacteria bacterium]|nr:hypothetical protein [Actinomycetota bacterium]